MQCNWNHFGFPSPALRDLSIIKNPISRAKIVPLPLTVAAEH